MPKKTMRAVAGPFPYRHRSSGFSAWQDDTWTIQTLSGTSEGSNSGLPLNTEVDDGNAWFLTKTTTDFGNSFFSKTQGSNQFVGNFTISTITSAYQHLNMPSSHTDSSLNTQGATAISRSIPSNPIFDLATFIGETRADGLPNAAGVATWRNRTHLANSAGDEYLNVEFGWLPFVSDLKNFAKAVNNSHEIWSRYRKGSGHKSRVGYSFPSTEDSKSSAVSFGALPSSAGTGSGIVTEFARDTIWFKGAFKYYIPEPHGLGSRMEYYRSQARLLYGLDLSPATVWNLTPWSWATDWFADTGDVLNNISRLGDDGLVLQYGYIMSQQTLQSIMAGNINGVAVSRTDTTKRCRRLPSNPYGFGVSWDSLSNTQLAVLAALGLSRV
jgi:hypothetical protein